MNRDAAIGGRQVAAQTTQILEAQPNLDLPGNVRDTGPAATSPAVNAIDQRIADEAEHPIATHLNRNTAPASVMKISTPSERLPFAGRGTEAATFAQLAAFPPLTMRWKVATGS